MASRAPRHAWFLLFLAAVFVVKVVIMRQLQHHPLLQPDAGLDTAAYVQLARRVLGGEVALGPGLYYMSPLYIYFLASALFISDSLTWVRTLQVALGTAAVGCLFVTTREWFGLRAAWIAASVAALTGLFTFYEVLVLQAALDTVLTAAALACLTLGLSRSRRHWFVAAGAIFGLQILNRPNVVIAVAAVVVAMALVRRWRPAAAWLAIGILLGLAPVVIRNRIVAGQWALASSQGGLNFYIGNSAAATGQYVPVAGVRANIEGQSEDTRRVAERAAGRALTDAEVSNHFAKLALTWIRDHPVAAARLFAKKLALVFNRRHQWLDLSYPYYAYDVGSALRLLAVGPWLLVPLGTMGLALFPKTNRAGYIVWLLFVPAYAFGVAVFFVAERYRLPMFLPLCVGAGAAIDRVVRSFLDGGWRSLMVPGAIGLLAAVVCYLPFDLNDGRFDERLRLGKTLMNRGEYQAAANELTRALEIDPTNLVTEFNLGVALTSAGSPELGIARIQHAIDAGVPIAGARYVLAGAMKASGDVDGAARVLRSSRPTGDDDAESCLRVGVMAIELKLFDVAETYFRRALALRPRWTDAQVQLGIVLLSQGRYPEAATELQSVVGAGTRDPAVYANLAYAEARLGRIAEARAHLAVVRQLDPTFDVGSVMAVIDKKR